MNHQRFAQACAFALAAYAGFACSTSDRRDGYYGDDPYYNDPYYDGPCCNDYYGGGGFNSSDVVSGNIPYDDDGYYNDGYYDDGYYDRPYYNGDDGYYDDGYYTQPYYEEGDESFYDENGHYNQPNYNGNTGYSDQPNYNGNYSNQPSYNGSTGGYNERPYATDARNPIIGIGPGSAVPGPSATGSYPQGNTGQQPAGSQGSPNVGPSGTSYADPYRGSAQYTASCLQGSGNMSTDYGVPGPYRVGSHTVHIAPYGVYTLFYPEPLDPNCTHPIIAWGNGPNTPGPEPYAFQNEHLASWGLVVAAAHNPQVADGEFHAAGIDYLLALNDDPRSPFFRQLSPHAGTSGHGTGGQGANLGARHPYVDAVVNVQGSNALPPSHVAFLCLTDNNDSYSQMCRDAVNNTSSPAMLAQYGQPSNAGYLGGSNEPEAAQFLRLSTGWFRCFLADDYPACSMFRWGDECPACRNTTFNDAYVRNF